MKSIVLASGLSDLAKLLYLLIAEEPCSAKHLEDSLNINQSQVHQGLDELIVAKYVQKQETSYCPIDTRIKNDAPIGAKHKMLTRDELESWKHEIMNNARKMESEKM